MNRSVFWKLFLTAALLAYAVFAMLPMTTVKFDDFATAHVTRDKDGFAKLLAEARVRVKNHDDNVAGQPKAATIFDALRDIANDPVKPIDLHAAYFPDLDLVKEPNLAARNNIILRHLLRKSQGKLKLGLDLQGGIAVTYKVPDEAFAGKDAVARQSVMDSVAKVMNDRVNGLGVAEPLIRTVGTNILEVQLAGENMANNPDALESLNKPAKLEFRMVHRYERPAPGAIAHTLKSLKETPSNPSSSIDEYEVLYLRRTDSDTGAVTEEPYYVKKDVYRDSNGEATGKIIESARGESQTGLKWETAMKFSSVGAKIFGGMTGKIAEENNRLGNGAGSMAIVLDNKLMSVNGIKRGEDGRYHALDQGSAVIEQKDETEAKALAGVLNNPLDVPLQQQDMQTVGPSLARDAQSKSVIAASVGVALVVVFMVAFYLWGGVLSIVAVIANLVMILGVSAAMGATITLPGVAALVLTVGMAVDANILVFERIRDEMKTGKSLRVALENGYSRALPTILDANITTLLTAGILIYMGTGPVRGFGVTLAIGIVTTLITTLITTRGLQELAVGNGLFTRMFGFTFLKKEPAIRFLDYTKQSFVIAWVVIIAGFIAIGIRGKDTLGKDFKGGEAVSVELAAGKKIDEGEVRTIAESAGVKDTTPTYLSDIAGRKSSLRIECELSPEGKDFANATKIVTALVAKHPDAFPAGKTVEQVISGREAVGATVSKGLQTNAIISVLLALLGIGIYITLRFEMGFGAGALVATAHDMLMTVGLCVIHGWIFGGGQFTASTVAAFLMAKGYSINDKVVVFDRIREEMEANPAMSLRDVIHLAINRTLSRTILLSLTVIFAAAALFAFGAGDVKEYGLVFVFGVITGTFSSIFIASPVFYRWHKGERKSVENAETGTKRSWELNDTKRGAKL